MTDTNTKTALITGASGFIGRRLRSSLLAEGVDVVAIRRPSSPEAKEGRSVVASYDDVAGLKKVMDEEKPTWVFHVAGVTKGRSYADFQRGNVMPTENLLEAISQSDWTPERFVMVSSLTSFGPSTHYQRPIREDDPRHPIEFYGRSKLEAERCVEESDVPWTILRPGGVYGPGDVDYFELFKTANMGLNVFFGNRDRLQSCIYVDDCVRGILEAGRHENTVNQGYFLADGEPLSWGRFQDEIVAQHSKRIRTLNLPEAIVTLAAIGGEIATAIDKKPRLLNRQKAIMGKQSAWTCSIDKAQRDFGFEVEFPVQEGVRLTHEWYKNSGWY